VFRAVRARFAAVSAHAPRSYWYVWWGTLVNRLGGMVVPLMTIYLTTKRHVDVKTAGAIVSGFGAGQMVAAIVGGNMADRIGRRTTMLLSLFGGAAAMFVLGRVDGLTEIAVAVLALGFVGEFYRPAVSAFVSDVVAPAHRVEAYGLLYWAVNLGFAIASALGGVLARLDFGVLFIADAATTAAFAVIVAIAVPETRPTVVVKAASERSVAWWRDRVFATFVALNFLLVLIPMQTGAVLSAHITQQGFSPLAYGAIMGANGLLIIVFQPIVLARIKPLDPDRVLVVASLLYGVGMIAHGLAPAVVAHVGAVVVWTFAEVLESSVRSAMVAAMAPADARGRYQGAFVMTFGAAALVAPRLGTQVWEDVGPMALWGGCGGLGVVCAIAFWQTAPARRERMAAMLIKSETSK
jgi:MFS family permease